MYLILFLHFQKFKAMKKISIGCDHAGFQYKERLKKYLVDAGFDVTDCGTNSESSVDYPDFAHEVAKNIQSGTSDVGILLCGSANGVNITANKHSKVRSALCWMTDIAALARQHNNANIIALPARFVAYELAEEMVKIFLNTEFEGGRHQNRVNKIPTSC